MGYTHTLTTYIIHSCTAKRQNLGFGLLVLFVLVFLLLFDADGLANLRAGQLPELVSHFRALLLLAMLR